MAVKQVQVEHWASDNGMSYPEKAQALEANAVYWEREATGLKQVVDRDRTLREENLRLSKLLQEYHLVEDYRYRLIRIEVLAIVGLANSSVVGVDGVVTALAGIRGHALTIQNLVSKEVVRAEKKEAEEAARVLQERPVEPALPPPYYDAVHQPLPESPVPDSDVRRGVHGTMLWYENGRCWNFTPDGIKPDVDHAWAVDVDMPVLRTTGAAGTVVARRGLRPGYPDLFVVTRFFPDGG